MIVVVIIEENIYIFKQYENKIEISMKYMLLLILIIKFKTQLNDMSKSIEQYDHSCCCNDIIDAK